MTGPQQKLPSLLAVFNFGPDAVLPARMDQRTDKDHSTAEAFDAPPLEAHFNHNPMVGHFVRIGAVNAEEPFHAEAVHPDHAEDGFARLHPFAGPFEDFHHQAVQRTDNLSALDAKLGGLDIGRLRVAVMGSQLLLHLSMFRTQVRPPLGQFQLAQLTGPHGIAGPAIGLLGGPKLRGRHVGRRLGIAHVDIILCRLDRLGMLRMGRFEGRLRLAIVDLSQQLTLLNQVALAHGEPQQRSGILGRHGHFLQQRYQAVFNHDRLGSCRCGRVHGHLLRPDQQAHGEQPQGGSGHDDVPIANVDLNDPRFNDN